MTKSIKPPVSEELSPDHLLHYSDQLRKESKSGCAGTMLLILAAQFAMRLMEGDMAMFFDYLKVLPIVILALIVFLFRVPCINKLIDGMYEYVSAVINGNDTLSNVALVKARWQKSLDEFKSKRGRLSKDAPARWLINRFAGYCSKHGISSFPPRWLLIRRVLIVVVLATIPCIILVSIYSQPPLVEKPDMRTQLYDQSPPVETRFYGTLSLLLFGLIYLFGEGRNIITTSGRLRDAAVLHVYAGLLRRAEVPLHVAQEPGPASD